MAERLGVDITFSSKRYLELMPAGVDKGTGLTRLADMLGIPMSEVIAVGDSANDLSMIKAAGLGVGVANVTDDVRPYCDVVLETAGTDGAFSELVMAERLGVDITFSSKRYLELMPAGVDKGTGLTRLADMLGIPMSEVIAVGDSANDLSMITAAGLGVGVANVTDDVRPYCYVVLETAGTDGAFSELVERFLEP